MISRDLKVFSVMLDLMNLFRRGVNSALSVSKHCIVFPTSFPEFIANLHVLVGHRIAIIVLGLLLHPKIASRTIEVGRNNVPSDSPFGEMIQRRHPASKRIRMFVGE